MSAIIASNQTLPWNSYLAIVLCRKVEAICPAYGAHVALTGGLLYKDGNRKDCDILFYRIRQRNKIEIEPMFRHLDADCGLRKLRGFGWLYKAQWQGLPVDCFFPEEQPAYDEEGNEIGYGE